MSKIYAFGDRSHGITLVTDNPSRVVQIPMDQIESFAREEGVSIDEVFDRLVATFHDAGGRNGWDVSRFYSMPEARAGEAEEGWDVSRFYSMPEARAGEAEEGWDVSRFYSMPEARAGEAEEGWDVSRFYSMPEARAGEAEEGWDVSRFYSMPRMEVRPN